MKTFIDSHIGLINVFDSLEIYNFIDKIETTLNGDVLTPGVKTNLNNFVNGFWK